MKVGLEAAASERLDDLVGALNRHTAALEANTAALEVHNAAIELQMNGPRA